MPKKYEFNFLKNQKGSIKNYCLLKSIQNNLCLNQISVELYPFRKL